MRTRDEYPITNHPLTPKTYDMQINTLQRWLLPQVWEFALTLILSIRRMKKMDIASTLRVVE